MSVNDVVAINLSKLDFKSNVTADKYATYCAINLSKLDFKFI